MTAQQPKSRKFTQVQLRNMDRMQLRAAARAVGVRPDEIGAKKENEIIRLIQSRQQPNGFDARTNHKKMEKVRKKQSKALPAAEEVFATDDEAPPAAAPLPATPQEAPPPMPQPQEAPAVSTEMLHALVRTVEVHSAAIMTLEKTVELLRGRVEAIEQKTARIGGFQAPHIASLREQNDQSMVDVATRGIEEMVCDIGGKKGLRISEDEMLTMTVDAMLDINRWLRTNGYKAADLSNERHFRANPGEARGVLMDVLQRHAFVVRELPAASQDETAATPTPTPAEAAAMPTVESEDDSAAETEEAWVTEDDGESSTEETEEAAQPAGEADDEESIEEDADETPPKVEPSLATSGDWPPTTPGQECWTYCNEPEIADWLPSRFTAVKGQGEAAVYTMECTFPNEEVYELDVPLSFLAPMVADDAAQEAVAAEG